MKKLLLGLVVMGLVAVAMGGWRVSSSADDRVQPIPDVVTDADGPHDPSPLMMRAKLAESQDVLEGLLNHDFDRIKSSAHALGQLAELAPTRRGEDVGDRIYEHFHTEFVRLCNELESMADDNNLEGAAYVHQNLTATCIACHSHLRDRTR